MLCVCMSIAGSVPVIVCLVLWLIQKENYHFFLGRILLLTSMFFYLVPFQLIKYVLPEWTVPLLKLPMEIHIRQDFYKLVELQSFISQDDSLWIPKWVSVIIHIWLCCIGTFAVYQILKYRIDIRRMLSQSVKKSVDINGRKTEILVNKNIHTPYTVGFIKQTIILPEMSLNHPCFEMCYRHEDQHRRNHDSFMKLIGVVIICIHWFNPIAILLLWLYSVTAEYICDAKATEGCSKEEKKQYARLLAELATEEEELSVVWKNSLSGSERLMRRRICYLMKRKSLMKKGIAIITAAITVFASASTILAYEPFMSADDKTMEVSTFSDFGEVLEENSYDIYDFSVSDTVVVYEDGTRFPIIMEKELEYALCNHVMKNCYYQVHRSNSTGGCTVHVYNAQRCTKCGYIKTGSLHNVITYMVCPHK